ncbi:MAG: hypothetical protein ACXVA2_17040 [Mucilaginibacter sp.]
MLNFFQKKEIESSVYNLNSETQKDSAEEHRFDVLINGQKVMDALGDNTYLESERAVSARFTINVINGKGIDIGFNAIEGEAILDGVQVKKIF